MPDLFWLPALPLPVMIGTALLLAFASNCTKQVKVAPATRKPAPAPSAASQAVTQAVTQPTATPAAGSACDATPSAKIQLPQSPQKSDRPLGQIRLTRSISFDIRGDRPS